MNFKKLLLAGVALCVSCVTAVAQMPRTTQLTANGQIPEDAQWYTMRIAADGYLIYDQESNASITLNDVTGVQDKHLWCFVGDNTTGYTIYNKAKGASHKFASPKNVTGDGGTTFPVLKAISDLGNDYHTTWSFQASPRLQGNGFFLHPTAAPSHRINKRGANLAYWTSGADDGSTVKFAAFGAEKVLSLAGGTLTTNPANPSSGWQYRWTSNETNPTIILNSGGYNNMRKNGDNWEAWRGNNNTCDYTLEVPSGYVITAYSFQFKRSANDNISVSAGGINKTSNENLQTHTVTCKPSSKVVAFTLGTANKGIILENFKVQVAPVNDATPFEVFRNTTNTEIPYRIPAIGTARNGHLIAVADYRYGRRDIGMGTDPNKRRLDLKARIFNGTSWGDEFTLVAGNESETGFFKAFGDPSIVGSRTTDEVLVLSCAGNVDYFNGTRNNHLEVARFVNPNNGAADSWGTPTNITEQFYAPLDDAQRGPYRSMFIGAGKIHQSRYIKIGNYYRLYVATLAKDKDGVQANHVYYSDDFGANWHLLGDKNTPPIPTNDANEPKVEELPDGSVVISSRPSANGAGRLYNVFKYTNTAEAKGAWGYHTYSNADNNGTATTSNSTNGEILILPVKRNSDGAYTYLALQSVPLGPNRSNVAIYYKELSNYAKFADAASFAGNWDGVHQVSTIASAYTTMTLRQDGTIGFLYEEDTYGVNAGDGINTGWGYTIVYKNYTLDQITGNRYTAPNFTEAERNEKEFNFIKTALGDEIETYQARVTGDDRYFSLRQSVIDDAKAARNAVTYSASTAAENIKTMLKNVEDLHAAVEDGQRKPYDFGDNQVRIRNVNYNTRYLAVNPNLTDLASQVGEDHRTVWCFEKTETPDVYTLRNKYTGLYIASLPANTNTKIDLTDKSEKAGKYRLINPVSTNAALVDVSRTDTNNSIHIGNTQLNHLPVRWSPAGTSSQYIITPDESSFNNTWLPALRTDLATAANLKETEIAGFDPNLYPVGEEMGQFEHHPEHIATARTVAANNESTYEQVSQAWINLANNTFSYNLPSNGLYRLKCSVSNKYVDGANHNGDRAVMNADAGTNANGIFFLTDRNELINYGSGYFLSNGYGVKGMAAGDKVTFALPQNNPAKHGKFSIKAPAGYLYDHGTTNSYLDRYSNDSPANCEWTLEKVTQLPINVPASGFATLCSPVSLTLPEGVTAYELSVDTEESVFVLNKIDRDIMYGEPVLIEATPGLHQAAVGEQFANLQETTDFGWEFLKGNLFTKPKTKDVLTLQTIDGEVGFFRYTGATLRGFRAFIDWQTLLTYLPEAPTQGLKIDFGKISAIEALESLFNTDAPAPIYDLQGRRHSHLQKGINIVNGKKIIVQ